MILNGKVVADTIKQQLKEEITTSGKRAPHLIIITVGEDPASKVYVRNKIKACEEIGIDITHIILDKDATKREIIVTIWEYNDDDNVDGIMVQLPLPKHLDERTIIDAIDPEKDVDGLTTTNIGKLRAGQLCIKPCTAQGIIDLLDYYNIEIDGKDATVVGRSNIVGKPIADLLMARGATVTQCHSHTNQLSYHTKMADIVVSAIGKPKFLSGKDIWDADAIIDVGINRDENGKLCGDIDYDDVINVHGKQTNITPVPGGVGPMTVAELMKNTVECWRKNI